jgi:hypothetical protein
MQTFELEEPYFVCGSDFELVDECGDHGQTVVVVPLVGEGAVVFFFIVGHSFGVALYEA